MGLLSLLFGESTPDKVEVLADRIWLTTDAKFTGLSKETADRKASDSVAILLVAQFPDVLDQLKEIDEQHSGQVPVLAVQASQLSTDLGRQLTLEESALIDIIVAERHPLRFIDDELEQLANELPCRSRLVHHLALDDAVMKPFAGQWVHDLLARLGMKEDEAIESPMVARRIKDAQQKFAERHIGDEAANSAIEWMEKNCPIPIAE